MVGANKQMCRNSHVLFTKSETGDKLAEMSCENVKIDQTLCFHRGKSGDRWGPPTGGSSILWRIVMGYGIEGVTSVIELMKRIIRSVLEVIH